MKKNQYDELMFILSVIVCFLIFGVCVLVFSTISANAAPIAGATYQTHLQTMRAPVAEWQQDILETINEEPSKEETKNGKRDNKRYVHRYSSDRDKPHLSKQAGIFNGPSGRETFYNLPMGGCIRLMEGLGYSYRYWIREDGVKMYGDYVMCAANLNIRPKGTILQTSLGQAIVCDTGSFAESNQYQLDIATNW